MARGHNLVPWKAVLTVTAGREGSAFVYVCLVDSDNLAGKVNWSTVQDAAKDLRWC